MRRARRVWARRGATKVPLAESGPGSMARIGAGAPRRLHVRAVHVSALKPSRTSPGSLSLYSLELTETSVSVVGSRGPRPAPRTRFKR
eukprot:2956236-Prymnesium_polylepis.1